MEELDLMPLRVERTKSPHVLAPDEARILQGIDVQWLYGRIIRAPGVVETQVPNSTSTILSAFVAVRRDCRKILMDGSAVGTVRLCVGNFAGLACTGPVNEWGDDTAAETLDEDDGLDGLDGGISC